MFISKITDHYGAWNLLQKEYKSELDELIEILDNIKTIPVIVKSNPVKKDKREANHKKYSKYMKLGSLLLPIATMAAPLLALSTVSSAAIATSLGIGVGSNMYYQKLKSEYISSDDNNFTSKFISKSWTIRPEVKSEKALIKKIDYSKNKVGVELAFGPMNIFLNSLFVNIASSIRKGEINVGIIILPTKGDVSKSGDIIDYEYISNFLFELSPFALKIPFIVIGISDVKDDLQIKSLTSDIDNYLSNRIGLCFEDLVCLKEGVNYEFKRELNDTKKLSKEVCAMANTKNGGLILFGVDDNGNKIGIDTNQQDKIQLSLSQAIDNNCSPKVKYDFIIELLPNSNKFILVLDIQEIDKKPCVYDNKVFVRSGSQSRPASSNEIRNLVLLS